MSTVSADQAVERARLLRPDAFKMIDVDFSLSQQEFRQREAQTAFAIIYGHLKPSHRR